MAYNNNEVILVNKIVYYCSHCGDFYRNIHEKTNFTCNFCKSPLLSTDMTNQEILEQFGGTNISFENIIFENFIKPKNTLNEKAYNKRQKYISRMDMSFIRPEDYPNQLNNTNAQSQNYNTPVTNPQGQIACAKCGSTQIQLVQRKWRLLTGFLTNKVDRICVNCKHRF